MTSVYFIKPIGFDGPIKIGCSYLPVKRKEQLSAWSPFPLEIIAELDGDEGVERRFHAKYETSFRGYEWFDVTPELLADIAAIKAGTFDDSTLPPDMGDIRFIAKKRETYTPIDWDYADLYGQVSVKRRAGYWPRGERLPTAPCLFHKMPAVKKAVEIAHARAWLEKAEARLKAKQEVVASRRAKVEA